MALLTAAVAEPVFVSAGAPAFLTAAQAFVARATTGTYFDSTGTMQTAGADVARVTYNPATLALQGTLLEPATTNTIRNNTATGAVVGTPGTLPTNWVQTQNTGLTPNVVGTGVENGIAYIDVQIVGTTAGGVSNNMFCEAGLGVSSPAATGQTWTASLYLRLVSGSLANISQLAFGITENNAAGSQLSFSSVNINALLTGAALNTQRFTRTTTTSQPTIAFTRWALAAVSAATGVAVNFTLRIGLPQLEQNAVATSAIATSSVVGTRSADIYRLTTSANENATAAARFGASVAETGNAADTTTAKARFAAAVGETGLAADATGAAARFASVVTEAGAAADTQGASATFGAANVETGHAADTETAAATLLASVAEAGLAIDTASESADAAIGAALSATASLTTSLDRGRALATSLQAGATFDARLLRQKPIDAALSAGATLFVPLRVARTFHADLSAATSLRAATTRARDASAALSAAATLQARPRRRRSLHTVLQGTATLVAGLQRTRPLASALSADALLSIHLTALYGPGRVSIQRTARLPIDRRAAAVPLDTRRAIVPPDPRRV